MMNVARGYKEMTPTFNGMNSAMSSLSQPQLQMSMGNKETSLSPLFILAIILCLCSCILLMYLCCTGNSDPTKGTQMPIWSCCSCSCSLMVLSFCYLTMNSMSSPKPAA
jgi:type VI protein secretion system component VasF